MPWTGRILGSLVILLVLHGVALGQDSSVKLSDISVDSAAGGAMVQIKISGAAKYRAQLLDKPPRLVIDLDDTKNAWQKTPATVTGDPFVKRVRASQLKKNVTRVVIELARKVAYEVVPNSAGLSVSVGAPALAAASAAEAAAKAAAQEAPPATGAPSPPPSNGGRLISLDFKDADVINLLRLLAAESGKNIVIGDDVKGKISIKLENVPWQVALDTILSERNLRKIETENLIRIASAERLAKEKEAREKEEKRLRETILFEEKAARDLKLQAEKAAEELESQRRKAIQDEQDRELRLKKAAQDLDIQKQELAFRRETEARKKEEEEREFARKREEFARRKEVEEREFARKKEVEEREFERRKAAEEAARREAEARGPLREETIRLSYADPDEVARTLQGILGIPPQGMAASPLTPAGPPPIAEPPFSQLFGLAPVAASQPPPTPVAEVLARGITIRANRPTNSIFIRHYASDLERIKKLIRETLDIPLPQVKIEARLESLDRFALENLGVSWGGAAAGNIENYQLVGQGLTSAVSPGGGGFVPRPASGIPLSTPNSITGLGNNALTLGSLLPIDALTGLPTGGNIVNLPVSALPTTGGLNPAPTAGFSFGIIGTRFNINLALQALAEQQKTRTIARPEVVTVENNKAMIQLGREIPYATVSSAGTQVQFRDAVLQLQVTPVVIQEGPVTKVKMTVLVENNEQGTDTAAGPTIIKRRAETQVLVKEGEHLVIGGVGTSTDSKSLRKVPLAGDIPLLGWLFKQRGDRETSSELVVFITPTVLRQGPAAGQPRSAR